jgi:serine/threonine protein phosphatase PrpC
MSQKSNVKIKAFGLAKGKELKSDDFYDVRIFDELVIGIVADGVGSAQKGAVASRRIVNSLIENFKNRPTSWDIPKSLDSFIKSINRILYRESMEDYERTELVSTLCVVVLEGNRLYGANVGDSRIYLLRDNSLQQLSHDHSMDEVGMEHVLTQAMGLGENVEPYTFENSVEEGDKILLCSDGLYNLLDPKALKKGLKQQATFMVKQASRLVEDDLPDDTSAVTIDVLKTDRLEVLKKMDLAIPDQLKVGDNYDGFILEKSLIQNNRTWIASRKGERVVMKFAPYEAIDDSKILDLFIKEAWNANRIKAGFFAKAWIPPKRSARYYMMEYVDGNDLKKQLKRKALSVDHGIELARFLLKASAYLAKFDLCHGDIKPENIILTERHGKQVFKLVDFGSIVEVFSLTSRAGTPSYLAPERFLGEMISERTEVFAIGVTLFEVLCNKYPYGEIEPFQTPSFKQPLKPRKVNKNIPQWLESLILRSIERDKEQRYSTYSEMLYGLDNPEKVNPYFSKDASLIEKDPVSFYKKAFFISLLLNAYLFVEWMSLKG